MPSSADPKLRSTIKLPITLHGPGSTDFLDTIRREFHLGNLASIEIVDQAFEDKDTLVYLAFARELPIEGPELGDANGIYARLGGNLTLRFDKSGQLSSYELEDVSSQDLESEKRGIQDLIRQKQLYFPAPREKVDVGKLISDKKRFYVETGKDGKRRLTRTGTI